MRVYSTVCVSVCVVLCCVGLVFDESQPPDATLRPDKQKPKVSLSQDPKQSKVYTILYSVLFHT